MSTQSRIVRILIIAVTAGFVFPRNARAQSDIPRFEGGLIFTALRLPDPIGEGAAGVGGRFGHNVNNYFGLEAEVNHFPGGTRKAADFGETEGLFGVKAGYGNHYGGLFFKARPGFIHFPGTSATAGRGLSENYFALDIGGVLERYWRNHTYFRFDFGDTIIAYGNTRYLDTSGNSIVLGTVHNPQISLGFGVHF
jgi:hypothetical protein